MNATKSKVQPVMAQMFVIPEYVDPRGAQMPPWGDEYVLSETICRRRGLDPLALMFYQHPDHSNFQRIRKGDICIVDTTSRIPQNGLRYLIEHKYGARVRKVFGHQDESLELVPEALSPGFRPEIVPRNFVKKLKIIGQVPLFLAIGD